MTTSIRPRSANAALTTCRTSGVSVTSRWASQSWSRYLSLRSCTASSLRTVPATRSPRARSCSVICRPKPLFTPVISQVRCVMVSLLFRVAGPRCHCLAGDADARSTSEPWQPSRSSSSDVVIFLRDIDVSSVVTTVQHLVNYVNPGPSPGAQPSMTGASACWPAGQMVQPCADSAARSWFAQCLHRYSSPRRSARYTARTAGPHRSHVSFISARLSWLSHGLAGGEPRGPARRARARARRSRGSRRSGELADPAHPLGGRLGVVAGLLGHPAGAAAGTEPARCRS